MSEDIIEEKTEHQVTYDKVALEVISELSAINQSIVIEEDSDDDTMITVKGADSNKSIAYIFKAPKEAFDFSGDDCSFFNYHEFYNLFSLFDSPSIIQDDTTIKLREGSSELEYRLTDSELIKKSFNKVKFEDPDVNFVLDADLLKKIKTLSGKTNVNAEYIKFSVKDDELTYTLYNERHHNTFKETIEVKNPDGAEFDIENSIRIFNKIPFASYKVAMKEEGLIQFTMVREDDINVVIYTADTEE